MNLRKPIFYSRTNREMESLLKLKLIKSLIESQMFPGFSAVDTGASVTLRCQTSSNVGGYLTWYLQKGTEPPNLLIYSASSRHSEVSSRFIGRGSGSDYSLTISEFEAEDAGVYYCQYGFYSF
uniref:Ig-like domain-containing protein n=1 Tax=Periophthalmus magnuspinnatus TaxID=409849 RepID=A0A3B4BIB1_9GOBI